MCQSEVGPDDFCRHCYGKGCEECNWRGHTVKSRPDVWWPQPTPAPLKRK